MDTSQEIWMDKEFESSEKIDEEKEDQSHIRTCPIYSDITEKYPNVDDDENLVKYLHEVLTRRDLIDDVENHEDD